MYSIHSWIANAIHVSPV